MERLRIRPWPFFCSHVSPDRYLHSTKEPYQILDKGYTDQNEEKKQKWDSQETFEPKQSFHNNDHENDKTQKGQLLI